MKPNYTIKSTPEKITKSISQPTKIIRDKIGKRNSTKKGSKTKKIKLKRMSTKFDTKIK